MKKTLKLLAMSLMATLWVGCESFQNLNGTSATVAAIKPAVPYNRIALTTVAEPTFYDIKIMAYDFKAPGITLPGQIVAGGFNAANKFVDQGRRNRRLTQTLDEWKFKLSDQLTRDVKEALEEKGYEVVLINPEYRRGGKFAAKLPLPEKPVDAYLDLYVAFAGYVAIKPGEPYVPTIETPIRLTDAFSGEVLYAGNMNYGGPVPVTGPTDLPAESRHTVRGWDNLCAVDCEVSPAVQGLTAGSQAIAKLVSQNIK
ncbi:MAG: YkuS family protein [Gammaproteobacteria bacterium]|nr:YkuS family protein [Gammaproteobacteria bacterium]